jgi:hypothetical protein
VRQRGAVSGWIGMPQIIGVVLAVALVSLAVTGNGGYALIAALVVACALPFALTTPDPPLARAARPPFAYPTLFLTVAGLVVLSSALVWKIRSVP